MVPLKVFDHRWRRKGNNCIKQVLTRWAWRPAAGLLWEYYEDLRACFLLASTWGQDVVEEDRGLSTPTIANQEQPKARPKM
jgi:hypothetical protein